MATIKELGYRIDVGRMGSIPQFLAVVGPQLGDLEQTLKTEPSLRVHWDLRKLEAGHVDEAALAAFASIAGAFARMTKKPGIAILGLNPGVSSFLKGIRFDSTARSSGILEFYPLDYLYLGQALKMDAATRMFCIPFDAADLPDYSDQSSLEAWKVRHRRDYYMQIFSRHGAYALLDARRDNRGLDRALGSEVFLTCAEFVANAHCWGKSDAFISIQAGRNSISVTVCDAGCGLRHSIARKPKTEMPFAPETDEDAAYFASFANWRRNMSTSEDYGLFRAIGLSLEAGGSVRISTGTAELLWKRRSWEVAIRAMEPKYPDRIFSVEVQRSIFPTIKEELTREDFEFGYLRRWSHTLWGTRIEFHFPITY